MKKYKEFIITCRPFHPDILTGILWELNIAGITEEDKSLLLYSEESENLSVAKIESILNRLISNNLLESFDIKEKFIEDKNWNKEWEKRLGIIEVSEKVIIKPPFKKYKPKPYQVVITIEPKMSFGTGEHETTKLMLMIMEKYLNQGDRVLDIGSGTGILSIAAAKLGAANVIGIDNDEWCYINGKENIKRNNVRNKVEIHQAELHEIEENNFDLILANINKNVLLKYSNKIIEKIKEKGILILSGLLWEDEEVIKNEYESQSLKILDSITMNEWIALVLKKVN